jgi:glycerol-3-phosphate cytidylyltransferase
MRVGFTASAFDMLHAGHVMMLREAKEQCDHLIVGLQIDPSLDRLEKHSPIQTIVERYIQLAAVSYVDEIVPYENEEQLKDILETFKIHVRVLGEEYKHIEFTGKDLCMELGIELYYNSRQHKFSSSDLRNRLMEIE